MTRLKLDRRGVLAAALGAAALPLLPTSARAAVQIGRKVPNFVGLDANGDVLRYADLADKTVILEWTNHDCPFVRKHYNTDNMQTLQKEATDRGIVWVQVISSAPGEQGHVDGPTAQRIAADRGAAPTHIVLDPDGHMGRAFDARVTPHMYIILPGGELAYMGGIDDKPSTNPDTVPQAKNYVRAALADLDAGGPVGEPVTRAYGCTVKYAL